MHNQYLMQAPPREKAITTVSGCTCFFYLLLISQQTYIKLKIQKNINLSIREGLSQSTVNCPLQDSIRGLCVLTLPELLFAWHQKRMQNLCLRLKSEAQMERLFEKYNISSREREIIQLIHEIQKLVKRKQMSFLF